MLSKIKILLLTLAVVLLSCATTTTIITPLSYIGTNLDGGQFGSVYPGVEGVDYSWPTAADVDYFTSKKMNTFRIGFQWERLQPVPKGEFAPAYFAKLDALTKYATSKGANVLLSPHNFARYRLNGTDVVVGSAQFPNDNFADLWIRLATQYKSNPRVIVSLMNEPHDMPTDQWVAAANAAIAGIRSVGNSNLISVPGNNWTGADGWANDGPAMLKIRDSANNYVFEVHNYFDADGSGEYKTDCASATAGSTKLANVTAWAKANKKKVLVGEFGTKISPLCKSAVTDMLNHMSANSDVYVGWLWWSAGTPWNDTYLLSLNKKNGVDDVRMSWLSPYLPGAAPAPTTTPTVPPTTTPANLTLIGTNANGGDMAWGEKNTANPQDGSDFIFISNQDIDYLAAKKIGFVRFTFSWEGMQPTINGPLANNIYTQQMKARVDYMTSKGLNVMIEPHAGADANFVRYKGNAVGTTAVPNSSFGDFWKRMAVLYKDNPRVIYGLSNEPSNIGTMQWFGAAQAAIDGIRSTGSRQMIMVPGNGFTSAAEWTNGAAYDTATPKVSSATGWLTLRDPVNNMIASVHMYLDVNGGGHGDDVVSPTIGIDRLKGVVAWGRANNVKIHLSEIGAASVSGAAGQTAIRNLFDYIDANRDVVMGWSWWAYGPPVWWGVYHYTLCPTNNYTTDDVKWTWIAPYLKGTSGIPTLQDATVDASVPDTSVPDASVPDATVPPSSTKPTAPIAFTADTVFTTSSSSPAITNWAYVPKTYDATHNTPMKLFVWLHGCGGQSEWDSHMVSFMPNQNWITLAPGGRELACWSTLANDGPKVLAAIADLRTHFNIDPSRIFLGGYSSGGDLGYAFLFKNSSLFAGGLFENTSPRGNSGMTLAATATNKLHLVHLAHSSDMTDGGNYSPTTVRADYVKLAGFGFKTEPVIEKPGNHYDADNGTTGTAYDLRTFLLPFLNAGWTNSTITPPPPPAACVYTYSAWGACQVSNTQTRTVTGSSPSPCTPSTQVLSQTCTYVPPVVDAGPVDSGPIGPTFYARSQIFERTDDHVCQYFFVKNMKDTAQDWSLMYVNSKDGTLRNYWFLKTNQTIGTKGSVKFTPITPTGGVKTIPAKMELNVGGACFNLTRTQIVPVITGIN